MSEAEQMSPGVHPTTPGLARRGRAAAVTPTVESLGIDVDAQEWQRSGDEADAIEIALVGGAAGGGAAASGAAASGMQWVLMRVVGDPAGRVLVYDRHEWDCFLGGAREGEFDDAACGHQAAGHCGSAG
jgi:hypothetical protein